MTIAKAFGIAAATLFVALSTACHQSPERLVLQREWTANAEFAGDVWASKVAAEHNIALDVREGSELIDPVKMVRSGGAQFGVASADRVLRENEGGAGLVVLAAATYKTPVVFLTNPKARIASPRDFRNHTIGIQPGTNTELVFQAVAAAQGIPLHDMRIVNSGWGTQTFESGVIDVLGAFAYDEPITLGLKHFHIGTIDPEAYGIRYVGTVYFTRKTLVDEQPQTVQSFTDALVDGWTRALKEPDAAMDILSTRFETVRNNLVKERLSFKAGRVYFSGENGHILYASQRRWSDMAKSLIALGKLKRFDFKSNIDYRFLEKSVTR